MNKTANRLLLSALLAGLFAASPQPVPATQEIKETFILSGYLGDNFDYIKKILRHAQEMQHQARPFTVKRHRERYRFEPSDEHSREIMTLARRLGARFKLINGLLYHANIPNKQLLYKQTIESVEGISTYGKRSIRAIRDNNYALYLASAQAIEKEVFVLNELLNSLELSINDNIAELDSKKESL